jgi:hypothetical protein
MARAAVIPQSPPKRTTRARTRVTTEATDGQNVAAEPAKGGRKPTKAATTEETKRKAGRKVADAMNEETDDEIGLDAGKAQKPPSTTRGRVGRPPKNAVPVNVETDNSDDDELAQSDVPKPQVGRPKGKSTDKVGAAKSEPAVKPTRGRPKATKTGELKVDTEVKKPRGRPTTKSAGEKTIRVAAAATTSSLAKSRPIEEPAKRKKVTFADVSDSEGNSSDASTAKGTKKPTSTRKPSQTGLRAKPVRKAGTTAARARGRPPKSQAAVQPLSPKKATQIAKSTSSASSDTEEDELCGEKTSYTLVVRSAIKHASQHTGLSSPVKKINFATSTPSRNANGKENDENRIPAVRPPSALRDSAFISSPARRLPGTTSKETFRDTPRRGPLFANEQSAFKPEAGSPTRLSPLKASPKKGGNLGASFLASSQKGSNTPFNTKLSLLKSPAKRIQSPFVFHKVGSPVKKNSKAASDDEDMDMGMNVSCHFQAVELPGKVYNLSDEEMSLDDTKAAREPQSCDDVFADSAMPAGHNEEDDGEVLAEEDDDQINEEDGSTSEQDDVQPETAEAMAEDTRAEEFQDTEDVQTAEEIAAEEETQHTTEDPDALGDAEIVAWRAESTADDEFHEEHNGRAQNIVLHAEPDDETDSVIDSEALCSPVVSYTSRLSIDAASPVSPYAVSELGDVASPLRHWQDVPPPAPSPPTAPSARSLRFAFRDDADDENSEYEASPVKRASISTTRQSIHPQTPSANSAETFAFTPLADQLSQWKVSSPEKHQVERPQRSIFSPAIPTQLTMRPANNRYTEIQSMRQSLAAKHSLASSINMDVNETDTVEPEIEKSGEILANEVENSNDLDSQETENTEVPAADGMPAPATEDMPFGKGTSIPMSITPVRVNRDAQRTVHTVSRVPLRPEGEISPLKNPRKRARSLSTDIMIPVRASPRRINLIPKSQTEPSLSPRKTRQQLGEIEADDLATQPEESRQAVSTSSPVKTPRRNTSADKQVLQGAVVFVDVHTTEGEDASGIFVELLTQMGAKCVKSWTWNPRASQSPVGGVDPGHNKIGITHIVFKDGGVRTLEKVRQAKGFVKCVGVGWVLEYVHFWS